MIINSLRGSSQNDLAGSTLDIAPTVLSSLGFVGELGLGRSLFEPALQPERDFVSRDGMLQSWQEDILQFWRFPEIKEGFYLNLEKKNISIDGRVLRLPMLAAIEGGALRPMFEFDASFDKQTLKYYFSTLPVGKFFLLVVPSGQIPEIIPGRQVPGKGWSIAFGRQGGDITILQFSESRRFDARWVEMYFRAQ